MKTTHPSTQRASILATIILFSLFGFTANLFGGDGKGEFTGTISVEKNEKGKAKSITFTDSSDSTTYTIQPGGKSARIAKEADGETVVIKGKTQTRKGKDGEEKILKVSKYEIVFEGTVEVEKKGKKITAITLGGRNVKLNSKSKAMAKEAEGKAVTATGTKSTSSKKKSESSETLTIKSYKLKTE